MNIDRAKRIAGSFGSSVSLSVTQLRQGLLVQYRQRSCYFTREDSFWAYIFTLAGVPSGHMDTSAQASPAAALAMRPTASSRVS